MANQVRQKAERAEDTAQRVTPGDDWISTFGRIGYAAKGVVYTIVGVLAVDAAFTGGGQTTGSRGALREIASQPFGQVLLVLTGIGLLGYAAFRLVSASVDPTRLGFSEDAKTTVKRIGYAVSGLINAALAFFALRIAFGSGGGGSGSGGSGGGKQGMTAELMSQPFGQWLVGIIGVIVIGVGLYHFYKAAKAKFMEKYNRHEMSRTETTWAKRIGRVGLSARGVTFCMIGYFVVQAALQSDASEVKGLGGAFDELLSQPYGPWLMGAVAIGFVCYGVYCFSYARYRDFDAQIE